MPGGVDPLTHVVRTLVEMMRLRARPQDLPASDVLLLLTLATVALASLIAVVQLFPLPRGAARVGCDLLVQLGLVRLALQLSGRGARFRQTFTAICGTGSLFVLAALPLYIVLGSEPGDTLATLSTLALLFIYVWSIIVTGHILRHAFDATMALGIGLAVALVVITIAVGATVVPAPEAG